MRSRFSILVFGIALVGTTIAGGAPGAGAALTPTGCGFHFGTVTQQGATGTVFYSVILQPLGPAQRCTAVIPFTVSATVAPVLVAKTGPYTNIDDNPLTAVQTVAFVPGRLPPTLTVAWADFHCADPAVPGRLNIVAGGQTLAIEITPNSCGPAGAPHSRLESLPIPVAPSAVGIAGTPGDQGYRTVTQSGAVTPEGNATALNTPLTHAPVVAIESTPTGNGTWVVAADGGVFTYGTVGFHGSLGTINDQKVIRISPGTMIRRSPITMPMLGQDSGHRHGEQVGQHRGDGFPEVEVDPAIPDVLDRLHQRGYHQAVANEVRDPADGLPNVAPQREQRHHDRGDQVDHERDGQEVGRKPAVKRPGFAEYPR